MAGTLAFHRTGMSMPDRINEAGMTLSRPPSPNDADAIGRTANPVGALVARLRAAHAAAASGSDVGGAPAKIDDALAAAIADIAGHYGASPSVAVLVAGLPLVDGRLPREHAADAAGRCGLAVESRPCVVTALADIELPAIAFNRDGGIDVVWSFVRDAGGMVVSALASEAGKPGMRVSVPAQDLAESADGEVLVLRPRSSLDERGEGAAKPWQANWFLAALSDGRRIYGEAIVATLAVNILALAMPLFSMNVYDRVLPNAAEATLWAMGLGVALAISFDFVIRTLRAAALDAASRRADARLSALIYGRLLGGRLSMQPVSAGVRANAIREFETLREFFNSATLTAFGELPFLVLFLIVMWVVAGPLALIVVAAIPLMLVAGWWTQKSLQRLVETGFREAAQKSAVAVETLSSLETLKAAGGESWAAQKWERASAQHIRTGIAMRQVSNIGQHVMMTMQTMVQLAVVVAGFYLVAAGQITMGALIAATILSGRAMAPLGQAAGLLARLNQARVAYRSLTDIVEAPQERHSEAQHLVRTSCQGALTFEGVGFRYDSAGAAALDGFSADIRPGERVAILGGIGSGKTTVLKLAQGFYAPQAGRVMVDGVSVSQLEPVLLRRHVGLLLQDGELFHGSIRENIVLGKAGVSDEALLEAARAAGALDWIARLPSGFDTLVRERGVGLSGGQRQSVRLARVLVRDPKVVLLDEPTSEMDGSTEQSVIDRLRRFMAGRTLVLVTHRPALLQLVDRIIVLENGKKIEDGPKEVVLERLRARSVKRHAAPASGEVAG